MTRPAVSATWATDPSYTHGPVVGQPNKSQPSTSEANEGFIPTEPIPADYLNFELNNHGAWIAYLDSAVAAGLLGDGSDGAVTFDGTATVLGLVPSSHVYTLTRDIFCTNITITGPAVIKTAGYRIFCQGTIDTTGSSLSAGVIVADGNAGNPSTGIAPGTGGAATPTGVVLGGAVGGDGGAVGSVGNGGGNVTNTIGNIGGGGGTSSGHGGGLPGTITPPTAAKGSVRLYSAPAFGMLIGNAGGLGAVTLLQGGSGGGGGGNAGGGGGSGGGVLAIAARNFSLKGTSDIRAKGGDGGAASSQSGGGGGGGGGVMLAYETINLSLTAASVAPGGAAGGVADGSTAGSTGNLYLLQFADAGATPTTTPAEQRGVVSFAPGGTGAGYEYQDVVFGTAMLDTSYTIELTAGCSDDVSGTPIPHYTLKTTAGFRIRLNDLFPVAGEVSWRARP